jgi:DNA-binding transcriptional LysR family regulator
MRVRKLEYLVALAREGHFARAASACHVSQPTLSTALRQLEQDMGVTILKRGLRYSGLTPQGERILAFAHWMAAECEHLRRDLEDVDGKSRGTLQMGVIQSATPIVPSHTALFYKQYPQVNVRLMEMNSADIQKAFDNFTLDVAITYLDEKTRRLGRHHTLYIEEYSLLFRRGGILSGQKSVSWEEAYQAPLCMLNSEMMSAAIPVRQALGEPAPPSHIETNSVTSVLSHVRSGAWVGLLPRLLATDLQASGELEVADLPKVNNPVAVGVLIPDRNVIFPLAEAFFKMSASMKGTGAESRHRLAALASGSTALRGR